MNRRTNRGGRARPLTAAATSGGRARGRAVVARTALILGGLLVVLGVVAGYLNRTVLDADTFADRADSVRRDPAVSRQLGEALTDAYLQRVPDAVALRPLLDTVGTTIAGSDLLAGPARAAARSFQRSLTQAGADDLVLRLVDTGAVLAAVLHRMDPTGVIPDQELSVRLARIGGQTWAGRAFHLSGRIRLAAWLLPALGLVMVIGGAALAPDRRRAVLVVGVTLTGGAGGLALALVGGSWWAATRDSSTLTGAVVEAGWSVFIAPLWWSVAVLVLIGLLVVTAAAAVLPSVNLLGTAARVGTAVATRPARFTAGLMRAVVALVVGLAAILRPATIGTAVVMLIGLWLLLVGVTELAEVTRRPGSRPDRPDPSPTDVVPARAVAPSTSRSAVTASLAAVVVLGLLIGWGTLPGSAATQGGDDVLRCNGDSALCDRPFPDVTYATSHNAMSQASDRAWFIPEQGLTFGGQLDLGVRALQVDVWPGYPTASGRTATARSAYAEARAQAEKDFGPETVAAALRVFDTLTDPTASGPERLYLCHGLCEIGASDFTDGMAQIAAWLDAHPDEVLSLIIQDHADPGRIGAALTDAGIASLAFAPPAPGGPWPTLGQLIGSGRRVLVVLEHEDGGSRYPWLRNGYEQLLQETPYAFAQASDFTCDPYRGRPDAPLFLINHWLTRFDRLVTAARQVNGADVLRERVRACRERRRTPTYLSVNYVDIGDLMAVVRELNSGGGVR